jgi:hypothetical protein
MYEQKFLDIREKLLRKRSEIYGEGSQSGPERNKFDNQFDAADAMASSILSRFESISRSIGMRSYNNNKGGGRGNNSGNNSNRGGNSGSEGSERNSHIKATKITPEIDELIIKKRTLRRRWQRCRDSKLKTELNTLQKIINEKIKEFKNENGN